MKLTTQDGRTLELDRKDCVDFQAVLYAGHEFCGKIVARLKSKKNRVEVVLGEYKMPHVISDVNQARVEIDSVERELNNAFARDKDYVMPGFKNLAPNDDLMATIQTMLNSVSGIDVTLGMINGTTNSSCGFNPDENGSYKKSLEKWQANQDEKMRESKLPELNSRHRQKTALLLGRVRGRNAQA